MKSSVEKVKQMKPDQLVKDNDQKQFSKSQKEQLSIQKSTLETEMDDYQTIKKLKNNQQQNYPNILTSNSKSQKRMQDVVPAQQSPKSALLSSKNSPKRLTFSSSKSFKQNLKTETPSSLTRHSSLSNVAVLENSKIKDKCYQSASSPFILPTVSQKITSLTLSQISKPIQSTNQTDLPTKQKSKKEKNGKKEVKNREKRLISTKSMKSILNTVAQQNTTSSLYVAPLFKVQLVYVVEKGNNSQIIKNVLNKRDWWTEATNYYSTYHLKWKPTSSGIKFDDVIFTPSKKQMVNHIENHIELSCKSKLYNNVKSCKKNEVDQFMPKTFLLNIESETYEKDIQSFVESFQTFQQDSKLKNIWILKPDDLNRGQGINVFNSLQQLYGMLLQFGRTDNLKQVFSKICPQVLEKYEKHLKKVEALKEIEIKKEQQGEIQEKAQKKTRQQVSNLNNTPKIVIIQKYIENPLLIENRKFDIRVWVLVDQDFKFYMFKEGYLRLSSEPFSLRSHKLQDKYVHLTNNAIQKYGKNYGKFENGNIISYSDYEKYLQSKNYPFTLSDTLKQIRNLIKTSFNCTKRKLFRKERKNTFEIFGYDFLVENDGHTYLIEINSNPCIEESNQHLAKIIPRMINDAFRQTIDRVFFTNSKYILIFIINQFNNLYLIYKEIFNCCFNEFALQGYSNFENLWEFLGSLQPQTNVLQSPKEGNYTITEA